MVLKILLNKFSYSHCITVFCVRPVNYYNSSLHLNRQYVTNAGEKESYNIKDLITMKAKNLPHLTNFDILQVSP